MGRSNQPFLSPNHPRDLRYIGSLGGGECWRRMILIEKCFRLVDQVHIVPSAGASSEEHGGWADSQGHMNLIHELGGERLTPAFATAHQVNLPLLPRVFLKLTVTSYVRKCSSFPLTLVT